MQATIGGVCAEALVCKIDSMNREIKFRAWDIGSNKIIYPDSKESNHVRLYLNGSVAIQDCRATQDVELMQRTGLNDSKGTPIYEGDIVEDIKKDAIGDIVWSENEAMFMRDRNAAGDYKHSLECVMREDNPYKVIGNVYENPELLP